MANLTNLFGTGKLDIAENVANAREAIAAKRSGYLAHQKLLASIADKSLAEAVSPLTKKKFSESFLLETSTGGYPQITLFPWLNGKGDIGYCQHPGAAIRAFVDAFGLMRYQTTIWHAHEASFDPTLPRVPEVLSVTQDGTHWQFYSWVNGAYKFAPMTDAHIGMKTAKHRELDLMLMALEYKRPLGLVLFREEWEAEYQTKIADRLELPVSKVLEIRTEDFNNAATARKMGQMPVSKTTVKPAVIGDIDLDVATEAVAINVFTPRSSKPVVILFDPSAANAEDVKNGIRNAAPGYTFEVVG